MASDRGEPTMRENGRMDYFPAWDGVEILNLFSQARLTLEARGLLAYAEDDAVYNLLNAAESALADRIEARQS